MASACAPESASCNTELMKFILYLLAPFYKLRAKVLELRLPFLFEAPIDQSESAHTRRRILCHRLVRQNKRFSLAPTLLQLKRQIEGAAEPESVPAHARGIREGHVGKALEQHRHQDVADSSPRQVRTRAMMRAVAKGLVRIGDAKRVVDLAVVDDVLVSVGGGLDRHHGVALRDEAAANLRVLHNEP